MTITIPPSIPSKASQGEKRFFSILINKLPDDFYIWYEPRLIINSRHPDFIILAPNFGLLVIEIKGWFPKNIISATTDKFAIETEGEDYKTITNQKSPLRQAKDYLDSLLNQLQKYRILTNVSGKYQGRLAFPIGWGAIMSNITENQAENINLNTVLSTPQVAYRNELLDWEKDNFSTDKLIERLQSMFTVKFPFSPLTDEQINTIKGVIYPEIIIREDRAEINHVPPDFPLLSDDKILITLDHKQENLAKTIRDGHRIFFGVAGSGKTLLLVARAKILINQNPQTKIVILCFNISLASYLRSLLHQDINNPQYQNIEVYNFDQWAKSILGKLPAKVEGNRDEYIAKLVLEKLDSYENKSKWDAILIDEAHTFVPSWFRCCVKALKDRENGDLIIVADGSQGVYKRDDFTWKEVGIKAVGRTISKKFDLDKNYRNTVEIINSAWSILREIQQDKETLETEEIIFPIIKPESALRHGNKPIVYRANSLVNQENLIISKLKNLIDKDSINPKDIAILYRQKNGNSLSNIMAQLNTLNIPFYWVTKDPKTKSKYSYNREGIRIITCLSSLGLEFKVVSIIWLEQFDDCVNNKQGSLINIRQLYVAMTRAKDDLFLFGLRGSKFVNFISKNENFTIID
jgi:hypothetical protein